MAACISAPMKETLSSKPAEFDFCEDDLEMDF